MSNRRLEEDTVDSGSTQPMKPVDARGRPPEPPGKRKRDESRPRERGRNGGALSLPAWSVGLMLLLVFGIAAGIVTLVLMLGGQTAPGGEPVIVIVTAPPTATSDQPPTALVPGFITAPTLVPDVPVFALEGPTLPPIIFTPTPLTITVGSAVIVNIDGLNVRPEPGLNNTQRFNAPLGAGFNVVGGPTQADGLTWWEIQDPADPTLRGWAAADYLDVFAP